MENVDIMIGTITVLILALFMLGVKFKNLNNKAKIKIVEEDIVEVKESLVETGKDYFEKYTIPFKIRDRFLEKNSQYNLSDYKNIEEALMDYFWIFLPNNHEKEKFYTIHSIIADELWHEFLLYEEEYEDFCIKSFNRLIEHVTHTEDNKKNSSFESRMNTYNALSKESRLIGFDLDSSYGVKNKYNKGFMNEISQFYDYDQYDRTREQNQTLSTLGVVIAAELLEAEDINQEDLEDINEWKMFAKGIEENPIEEVQEVQYEGNLESKSEVDYSTKTSHTSKIDSSEYTAYESSSSISDSSSSCGAS